MGRKIGFIGLGRMGAGMALNLLHHNFELFVLDPSSAAMVPLLEAGATACETPEEMASKCETIVLCLPFSPEVREVIFGINGISGAKTNDLTVLDATTLDRQDALDIAKQAANFGIAYWDCPVSGMPFRAQDGSLTVMFGGTASAFETAKPILGAFGDTLIHCGDIGCGQAMKAINNIIYNINIVALCEVLPLTVAIGLDPEEVEKLVTSASSRSFASEYFVPKMIEREFDKDFAMADAYKDISNVQQMAQETGAQLPVVDAMVKSYEAAMAAGFGREPKSSILKVYENLLDVKFCRPHSD